MAEESRSLQPNVEGSTKVSENSQGTWSTRCNVDAVTLSRTCFAGTFGRSMTSQGAPFGSNSIPFQVYFLDDYGPFVSVGYHTYPGRHPVVRIDAHEPLVIHNDAGVSAPLPDQDVVTQLRSGKVAKARYHVWPEGARELYVELDGFDAAWQRLGQLRKK